MTFDSLDFLIFFAVVFSAWLVVRNAPQRIRNGILLLASYFFYGYWDYWFLALLVTSTLIDFYLGQAIYRTVDLKKRKQLVSFSVVANLGILGFFKYFNFFVDSAVALLPEDSFIAPSLRVILPVGISFYTFQSMSYTIDIYRKHIKPADSLIDFALYVTFFPQLVAGPIERASQMLPQFLRKPQMSVEKGLDGLELCIRGFFKKIVIADNVAPLANLFFADVNSASSLSLWMASFAFTIQIYADFSAYTDIARGTSKMLGFELMENFNSPYRSLNVSEFWRRWHISLSTWLRDYLYIPLGGNQGGKIVQLRNVFLVMALGGLWHGAAWTFVLWGLFHGSLLVIYHVSAPVLKSVTSAFSSRGQLLFKIASWFLTFNLINIGLLIFRAESVGDIPVALEKMFLNPVSDILSSGFSYIPYAGVGEQVFYIIIIFGTLIFEFIDIDGKYRWSKSNIFRGARAATLLAFIAILYPTVKEQFIYFQF